MQIKRKQIRNRVGNIKRNLMNRIEKINGICKIHIKYKFVLKEYS